MGWDIRPETTEILAVHAALLRSGKVLLFSGSQHDSDLNASGNVDATRLWDPDTGALTTISSPSHDLFCAGHAFLADGRLVVAGGTQAWSTDPIAGDPHGHDVLDHFRGLRDVSLFDSTAEAWSGGTPMLKEPGHTAGGGRWYPTLVTLPNGRLLTVSGHPEESDTRHNNTTIEAYASSSSGGTWHDLGDQPLIPSAYPRAHVLPGGRVFFTRLEDNNSYRFDPNSGSWSMVAPGPGGDYTGINTTSVLLPLNPIDGYLPRVLVCGGAAPRVIAPSVPTPTWIDTSPRMLAGSPRRNHANAVLLPTGEVFVTGGVSAQDDSTAVLPAEIYDPANDSWRTVESASVVRNYHSVALLLPDGRVWTAGSNVGGRQSFDPPGSDNRELRIEIYSPSYVTATRPAVASAPGAVTYGETFDVVTPDAADVARVAAVRGGSVTHSFNADQRYVRLQFSRSSDRLHVTAPPDAAVAPAGYYLIFLLDPNGVPSLGRFVRIGPLVKVKDKLEIKEFKENKEFKLEIKEIKEFKLETKEHIPDKGPKEFKEKDKDIYEGPELRPELLGPESALQDRDVIDALVRRIERLEAELPASRSFIEPHERPRVAGDDAHQTDEE